MTPLVERLRFWQVEHNSLSFKVREDIREAADALVAAEARITALERVAEEAQAFVTSHFEDGDGLDCAPRPATTTARALRLALRALLTEKVAEEEKA